MMWGSPRFAGAPTSVCAGREPHVTLTIVQVAGRDGGTVADENDLERLRERIAAGGADKYHEANRARGKLFARERGAPLVGDGSFVADGMVANAGDATRPADGGSTGGGRPPEPAR